MSKFHKLWVALCLAMSAALSLAPVAPAFVRAQEEPAEESVSSIEFAGQLIELSTTEAPTTIVVRDFNVEGDVGAGWTDYTVEITTETAFGTNDRNTTVMSDWITGDWALVIGDINENTNLVTADVVINQSLNPFQHRGLNGWITAIDLSASTVTVQWQGVEHAVNVTGNTKMVVPPINPAALSDFQIGDRVRLRLLEDSAIENEARIIVALRRGNEIFLKGRTRQFRAELVSLSGAEVPAELEVALLANPHLRLGDVNNLIGVEGEHKVALVDEHTKLVRRFVGEVDLSAFLPGDVLFIVGRANDDGTITAKLIRDDNVVASETEGTHGRITSIDYEAGSFVLHGGRRARGHDRTVTTDESTYIERDGVKASFADLMVDDKVRARYTLLDEETMTFSADQIFARSPEFKEEEEALVEDDELKELNESMLLELLSAVCGISLEASRTDDDGDSDSDHESDESDEEDESDESDDEDEDEDRDEEEDEDEEEELDEDEDEDEEEIDEEEAADALEDAEEAIGDAEEDLSEIQAEFPEADFSAAEDKIAVAKEKLAEARELLAAGLFADAIDKVEDAENLADDAAEAIDDVLEDLGEAEEVGELDELCEEFEDLLEDLTDEEEEEEMEEVEEELKDVCEADIEDEELEDACEELEVEEKYEEEGEDEEEDEYRGGRVNSTT